MVTINIFRDGPEYDWDVFAPNEYLEGRSPVSYMLTHPDDIMKQVNNKKEFKRASLINEFLRDSKMKDKLLKGIKENLSF